jgi:hypothetical protein
MVALDPKPRQNRITAMPNAAARPPVDWTAIDWSQQNRDIVEQTGRSASVVCNMRKALHQPRPKYWHKRKTSPQMLEKWSRVDWRLTNRVIARRMNVSYERARQMRVMLGKPRPTIRPVDPRTTRALNRVKSHLRKLRGNLHKVRGLSLSEAAKQLGMPLDRSSPVRKFLDGKGVLRKRGFRHPWHLMTFDIGDTALAEIWGIRRAVISIHRIRHHVPRPKWSGIYYGARRGAANDAAYRSVLQAEQARARHWREAHSKSFPTHESSRSP